MNKITNLYIIIGILVLIIAALIFSKNNNRYGNNADYPIVSDQEKVDDKKEEQDQLSSNNITSQKRASSIILDSDFARTFKTRLNAALSLPPNFNKTMSVVEIGCGSGCAVFGVVDLDTGKVYEVGTNDYGSFNGMVPQQYSLDSNVITLIGDPVERLKFENGKFIQQ